MTEQTKIRKFKLIDREGFLAGNTEENEDILKSHLRHGIIKGFTDEMGNIGDSIYWNDAATYIFKEELTYFEEIFEEDEKKTFTYNSQEWLVVCKHPEMDDHTIIINVESNEVDCLETTIITTCMKPLSWQEQVESEFGFEYSVKNETFYIKRAISEDSLIKVSKRIIELSEGVK